MNNQKIVQKKQILLDKKKNPMNNFRHIFMKEELNLFSGNNKSKKVLLSNITSVYNAKKRKKIVLIYLKQIQLTLVLLEIINQILLKISIQ